MKTDIELSKKATEVIEMFYAINDSDKENLGTNPYISRHYAKECAALYAREQSVEVHNAIEKIVNDNIKNKHEFNLDYLIERYAYWQGVLAKIYVRIVKD
jgi:hypothetical protein